jgi:hypothetical protein
MNGYILGPILIILGAMISYYTGMLIVRCSEHTNRTRYEDIADAIYGKKVSRLTSFLNLICLIGFTFSYIVYVKKAVPTIIEIYISTQPQAVHLVGFSIILLETASGVWSLPSSFSSHWVFQEVSMHWDLRHFWESCVVCTYVLLLQSSSFLIVILYPISHTTSHKCRLSD